MIDWPGSRVLDHPGISGIRLSDLEYSYYDPIARFFRDHTHEDERVYSGLLRHDAIVHSKPILYAVTGRASCCRYSELHRKVVDRAVVQQEIIADIERHKVRAVLIWNFGWPDKMLEGFKAKSMAAVADAGATLLDDYIAARYEPVAQYHEYVIMWLKSEPLTSGHPLPENPGPGNH